MPTILSIKPHSCVDLITNSSTTLFIWDVSQTLQAVKETIIELAKQVGDGEEAIDESRLFTDIMLEPTVCLFDFDMHKYPRVDIYKSFNDYNQYTEHPLYLKCRKEEEAFEAVTPRPTEEKARQKWNAHYHQIWKPWRKAQEKEELALYRWIFKQNHLPWTHVPGSHDSCPEFWVVVDQFRTAISYGYTLQKGAVMIYSKEDNSIPWPLVERIEGALPCRRLHLG